eukprot:scaffold79282_cov29-Tisochrysis_lutea.AAC.2
MAIPRRACGQRERRRQAAARAEERVRVGQCVDAVESPWGCARPSVRPVCAHPQRFVGGAVSLIPAHCHAHWLAVREGHVGASVDLPMENEEQSGASECARLDGWDGGWQPMLSPPVAPRRSASQGRDAPRCAAWDPRRCEEWRAGVEARLTR